jgi:hypothetical protein
MSCRALIAAFAIEAIRKQQVHRIIMYFYADSVSTSNSANVPFGYTSGCFVSDVAPWQQTDTTNKASAV